MLMNAKQWYALLMLLESLGACDMVHCASGLYRAGFSKGNFIFLAEYDHSCCLYNCQGRKISLDKFMNLLTKEVQEEFLYHLDLFQ